MDGQPPTTSAAVQNPPPRFKASTYLASLKVPIFLLCLFATALAGYYFFHVTGEQDYLTARNFRLLATMGEQIDSAIENDRQILINLRRSAEAGTLIDAFTDSRTADFIPILRSSRVNWSDSNPSRRSDTVRLKFVERESRLTWVRHDEAPEESGLLSVSLDLDDLLKPFLGGEVQKGIFDKVLVATIDGRVMFQTGDSRLRITRLDNLPATESKAPGDLKFDQLARSSGTIDVRLSGSRYKLLMQPCCGRMVRDGSPATEVGDGWILCGLVAQRALSAASSAIPFPIMKLLMPVLLLGLFSWPFLKLVLMGEAQRVRAHDAILVGLCALLGLALITVWALDLYGFSQLENAFDEQLRGLAASIKQQAREEVERAYSELTHLEGPLQTLPGNDRVGDLASSEDFKDHVFEYPFFESVALLDSDGDQKRKLAFDSFVTPLIRVPDRAYFKYWRSNQSSARAFLQPLRSATTGSREAVLSKPIVHPEKPGVTPASTSLQVVALTMPMHALINPVIVPGFGFAVVGQEGKVLFHSDPHHNLSEDFFAESDDNRRLKALISARHEEWADIKYWGRDHRAFVTPMDLSLDSARREPVALFEQPWTLVTFYDKDLTRTINVEWLVLIVLLVLLYTGAYVAICLVISFVRPKYRAPWLWPDPTQSTRYVDLFPLLLMLAAAYAVSIVLLSPADLIQVAWLLPFLACVLTYLMLTRRTGRAELMWAVAIGVFLLVALVAVTRTGPLVWRGVLVALLGGSAAWTIAAVRRPTERRSFALAPPVNVSYGIAAGLFVLLIAAMPAAAFFRIAYDLELENFIKYGQLQATLDRIDHDRRADEITAQRNPDRTVADRVRSLRASRAAWYGGYDTCFFDTRPLDPTAGVFKCPPVDRSVPQEAKSTEAVTLPMIAEELLPFYSESSVRLRELVHDRAADQSWRWFHSGGSLVFCMGTDEGLALTSSNPQLVEWSVAGPSRFFNLFLLTLVATAVLGAVVCVVRFIIHKVFVVDVIEPLWSGRSSDLGQIWGPHLFVVGGQATEMPPHALSYCEVDLTEAPLSEPAGNQWVDQQVRRLEQSPVKQNTLILHFEHRMHDRSFNERKLALVEHVINVLNRTVVIVSAVPPGSFFAASSAEPRAGAGATDVDWTRRWARALSRFVVIPVIPVAPAPVPAAASTTVLANGVTAGWREIVWRLNALGFAHSAKFLDDEQRDAVVGGLWKEILPYAWHPDRPALDLSQLLVEVGDRAEGYFWEIWSTCTPTEKLVLWQIAEEGLVNEKTKKSVRLLMARGLVRRQPHFVLMTETFRRFVLSSSSRTEVEALEEQSTSTWNAIRWPFLAMLIASLAFFFATQQELYKTVLGVLTAAATVVPALVKIASLVGDRRSVA